jgi:hypothetical protein
MKIDSRDATVQDMRNGYSKKENRYSCLLCDEEYEDGVVYPFNGKHYEAFRAIAEHVKAAHGSVFLHLLESEGKFVGLTQHQYDVLALMHAGLGDREIAERLPGSSAASIRNLRFQLREKEKQAKAYLALMEAFRAEREAAKSGGRDMIDMHEGATMADERFEITEKERAAVVKTYFNADGSLKEFPVREKRKVIVLREIAARFEKEHAYTEKEVNTIIGFRDFALVRRYLVEYGFLKRPPDCSEYRVL